MAIAIVDSHLTIIQPSGHINASNVSEFQRQLTTAVASQQHSILVDMSRVESLDSAGLMALISALTLAQSLKRRLSLCGVTPSIQMIFELTQLDGAFEIFESREAFAATNKRKAEASELIAVATSAALDRTVQPAMAVSLSA